MITLSSSPASAAVRRPFHIAGLRWYIIGAVFLATLINYLDRLTLSVLAPVLMQSFHLSNLQFATISTWFLAAYTVSQGLSGLFYDRVGTRAGFSWSILMWSTAAIAHTIATGFASLSALRFLLGLGEAGNWPGAAKVAAEWFPVRQRAFAMSIFNSGAAIGSILAPPLIVWLQLTFSWRAAFLVTGVLGFLWLGLWQILYRPLERHPWLSPSERDMVLGERTSQAGRRPWLELLGIRKVWALIVARFLTDPIWWLYITWLPLYLFKVRGFSLKDIGLFAWIPYVAADLGSLTGGWLSGALIARGWSVDGARKVCIAGAALLMCAGIGAPFVRSPLAALALIGVVLFGFQAWINNVQTVPADLFPGSSVASVAGLGGVGAGAGAMLFTLGTGWVVDRIGSYTPVLITAGLLPLASTAMLFLLLGRIPDPPKGVSS